MKYRAVIFDLDGTLIDSLEDLADSTNSVLANNNFPTHLLGAYKYFIGNGAKNLVKNAAPNGVEDFLIETMYKEFIEIYAENYANKTHPYEGILELLDVLKNNEIKMAVCSNKPDRHTKELVNLKLGMGFFEMAFGERANVPRKPDPTALLEAAKIMNINAADIVYVGDSGSDMRAAKNAGMVAAGALWGFREKDELLENGADILLASPLELINVLLND